MEAPPRNPRLPELLAVQELLHFLAESPCLQRLLRHAIILIYHNIAALTWIIVDSRAWHANHQSLTQQPSLYSRSSH